MRGGEVWGSGTDSLRLRATKGTEAEEQLAVALAEADLRRRGRRPLQGGADGNDEQWTWIDRRNRYLVLRGFLSAWEDVTLRPLLWRQLQETVAREPDVLVRDWLRVLLGELEVYGSADITARLKAWWHEQRLRQWEARRRDAR